MALLIQPMSSLWRSACDGFPECSSEILFTISATTGSMVSQWMQPCRLSRDMGTCCFSIAAELPAESRPHGYVVLKILRKQRVKSLNLCASTRGSIDPPAGRDYHLKTAHRFFFTFGEQG